MWEEGAQPSELNPPSFPTPTTAATAHSGSSTTQQGETKGPAQLCLCWRENSDPSTKALIKKHVKVYLKISSEYEALSPFFMQFPPFLSMQLMELFCTSKVLACCYFSCGGGLFVR